MEKNIEVFPGSRKCDAKHWAFLLPHEIDKTLSLVNHFLVFIWIHLKIYFPNFQHMPEYCNDFTPTGTTKRLSMICCFSACSAVSCWLIAFTASFIAFSLHTFPQWLQKPFESHSSLPLLTSNLFKNAGAWKSKFFNSWVLWSYSRNLG